MPNIKITNKNGITLKTAGKYCAEDIGVTVDESLLGITPNGELPITENGNYDVTNYESVDVNVPIPEGYIQPEGTFNVGLNGIWDITNYAKVNINVKGKVGLGNKTNIPSSYNDTQTTFEVKGIFSDFKLGLIYFVDLKDTLLQLGALLGNSIFPLFRMNTLTLCIANRPNEVGLYYFDEFYNTLIPLLYWDKQTGDQIIDNTMCEISVYFYRYESFKTLLSSYEIDGETYTILHEAGGMNVLESVAPFFNYYELVCETN